MSDIIVNLEFWFSISFVIDEGMMHDKWTSTTRARRTTGWSKESKLVKKANPSVLLQKVSVHKIPFASTLKHSCWKQKIHVKHLWRTGYLSSSAMPLQETYKPRVTSNQVFNNTAGKNMREKKRVRWTGESQASIAKMRGLLAVVLVFISLTDTGLAAVILCPLRNLKTANKGKPPCPSPRREAQVKPCGKIQLYSQKQCRRTSEIHNWLGLQLTGQHGSTVIISVQLKG